MIITCMCFVWNHRKLSQFVCFVHIWFGTVKLLGIKPIPSKKKMKKLNSYEIWPRHVAFTFIKCNVFVTSIIVTSHQFYINALNVFFLLTNRMRNSTIDNFMWPKQWIFRAIIFIKYVIECVFCFASYSLAVIVAVCLCIWNQCYVLMGPKNHQKSSFKSHHVLPL